MPTEPEPTTLAQVVHRAVEVCDPEGEDDALSDLILRFEDRDEPVAALERIDQVLAEEIGKLDPDGADPALIMASGVGVYLAHRRDHVDEPREDVMRLAARAEFDGKPPVHVHNWLESEGVAV